MISGLLSLVRYVARKAAYLLSFHVKFGRTASILLSSLIFVIAIVGYALTAEMRHAENGKDKIVPTVSMLMDGFKETLNEFVDENEDGTNDIEWYQQKFFVDFKASMVRFGTGLLIVLFGIVLGLHMRLPLFKLIFLRFFLLFEKIPPLALLAILFVAFGTGDEAKIALIVIGVLPKVVLDTQLNAEAVPMEQTIKGFSLGGNTPRILWRIILPQILPKIWNGIRLSLGLAVGFLIEAEGIAASEGIGYRIFVVRRYMGMNIIIDYILVLALIMFLVDWLFQWAIRKKYPWFNPNN